MIKNNGCCDLKYAQRLKELGVKQESLWWWNGFIYHKIPNDIDSEICQRWEISQYKKGEYFSAFTVVELLESMPFRIRLLKTEDYFLADTTRVDGIEEKYFTGDIPANALAKMKIWLIEQGKI